MCNFFSAIVARDGQLFWNDQTDSHELLIKHFGLKEGNGAGMAAANFIRLEFSPKSSNAFTDPEAYTLHVDESETPVWFTDDMKESVVEKLKAIISRMIVSDRRVLLGGCWILTATAEILESVNARIVYADGKAIGHRNTGQYNTGHCNTGNYNTGHYNTGQCNTGHYNTGNYNTGDRNTGFFCTDTPKPTFFDKPWDGAWDVAQSLIPRIELPVGCKWVYSNDMSSEEKADYPNHAVIGGYLKKTEMDIKTAFPIAWKNLTADEKKRWKSLPNFDAKKFFACTGVDVNKKAPKILPRKRNKNEKAL